MTYAAKDNILDVFRCCSTYPTCLRLTTLILNQRATTSLPLLQHGSASSAFEEDNYGPLKISFSLGSLCLLASALQVVVVTASHGLFLEAHM